MMGSPGFLRVRRQEDEPVGLPHAVRAGSGEVSGAPGGQVVGRRDAEGVRS